LKTTAQVKDQRLEKLERGLCLVRLHREDRIKLVVGRRILAAAGAIAKQIAR
jgi:hypothetical protein